MSSELVPESDKFFWHRYDDFYEAYLLRLSDPRLVMEFGVAHGASIHWLMRRFPKATIIGCDILPVRDEWPHSRRVVYKLIDQGSAEDIAQLFGEFTSQFDLIIEDGSHLPAHQKNCLVTCLPFIRPGGIYFLEDLHTSHPAHPSMKRSDRSRVNCYHVLLAFERLLALNEPLSDRIVNSLTSRSLFTPPEILELFRRLDSVKIFHRASLPLKCWKCGSDNFDYAELRCQCGAQLVAGIDSISAALVAKAIS